MLEEREASIRGADEAEVEEDLIEVEGKLFVTIVETRTLRARLPKFDASVMPLLYLV